MKNAATGTRCASFVRLSRITSGPAGSCLAVSRPRLNTETDWFAISAEVKHWYGAAKDSWMQHLTYHKDVQEGTSNEWLEL